MKAALLCMLLFGAALASVASAEMTEEDIDTMSTNILTALDEKMETLDDEDSGRSIKVLKEGTQKIGQKLGALLKKVWNGIPKDRIKKAVKSTIRDVKDSLTEKGKKYLIGEGKKQAKSFLKHELLKFISKNVLTETCSCGSVTQCGCCVRAPALEKACFNMTAIPDEQKFRIKATYGGEVLIGKKVSGDKELMTCTHLPSPLDIVEICIVTQGIQEIDKTSFRSCFRIVSHGKEVAKCILFENGKASLY